MVLRPELRTDDELLISGDAGDFEVFYRRHAEWVLGYLARRTRDADLAADLCAEVFAAALLSRPRYRARDGHANSWLFRIAANKLADAQRRGYAEDRARRRSGVALTCSRSAAARSSTASLSR
jgi:RNA polymerase sigma-70 factor (ECF subfamily)